MLRAQWNTQDLSHYFLQYAAQQHESSIAKHYESLLHAQQTASTEAESTINSHVALSLHRLTHCLRLLLRSMGGEDVENEQTGEDNRPLEDLGSFLFDEEREDWTLEREVEIARLEKENEELRRILGVDDENARKLGWHDEEAQVHRPVLPELKASRMAVLQESWAESPPQDMGGRIRLGESKTTYKALEDDVLHQLQQQSQQQQTQQQQQQQQQQSQQQQAQQNIPLQRQGDFQPGMRAGTLRRPSMLRGRGSAPFMNQQALPQPAERGWMPGLMNSGLDLAG